MTDNKDTEEYVTPSDDDVFDVSPSSTLQGGSLSSPTSPDHQPGILARFRNSFASQKVKELKRKVRQLEEENTSLKAELQNYRQDNTDFNVRLTNLVQGNPFKIYIQGSCRNVQVGGTNNLVQNQQTETLIADLEELTAKLTSAVQENTQERTNAEVKRKHAEVLLKEMKDSLEICKQALNKLDRSTSNKLGQLMELLESLTSDRSDDRVITVGIQRLRQHVLDRKRMVRTADGLPWDVKVAVTRLVNKFDDLTWQEFARIVDVSESAIQARGTNEDRENSDVSSLLNKDMCARILTQWVSQSTDNDGEKLLNIVHGYEENLSKEMTEYFEKKTVSQSLIPTVVGTVEPNQRSSMTFSDTSGGSGSWSMHRAPSQLLPDQRTQFEHQIEAWKLQEQMNMKLDRILKLMTEQNISTKKKDLEMKEDAMLQAKLMNQGHFV